MYFSSFRMGTTTEAAIVFIAGSGSVVGAPIGIRIKVFSITMPSTTQGVASSFGTADSSVPGPASIAINTLVKRCLRGSSTI